MAHAAAAIAVLPVGAAIAMVNIARVDIARVVERAAGRGVSEGYRLMVTGSGVGCTCTCICTKKLSKRNQWSSGRYGLSAVTVYMILGELRPIGWEDDRARGRHRRERRGLLCRVYCWVVYVLTMGGASLSVGVSAGGICHC